MSIYLPNDTSALLIFKKDILRITSNLVSATRKISWKNLGLFVLSSTWKSAITIPKVSRAKLSIFWAPTLVFQTLRPSFQAKLRFMILTLLPLSSRAFIYFFWNWTRWMQSTLTTSSPPSVTGTEIAKTNASFLAWCNCWHSGLSYCSWNMWP